MSCSLLRTILVAVALVLLAGIAFAQADPPITPPQAPPFQMGDAINGVVDALLGAFRQQVFAPSAGLKTIYALVTIMVVFSALRMGFLGDVGFAELLVDWFKLAAIAAVAVCAITPLDSLIWLFGAKITLGQAIENWFLKVAGLGNNVIGDGLKNWMEVLKKLMNAPIVPPRVTALEVWPKLGWLLTHCITLLGALIFQVLAVVALGLAAVITVGHLLAAKILMSLAISMAPVLVPWILFRPMQFLFDAWLKTLITGGMLLVVGSFFTRAGMLFADAMNTLMPRLDGADWETTSIMITFFTIFLACLLFIVIAQKLDGLARTLVSGSGISGFGLAQLKSAMSATGAVASGPGKAASAMAGAAHGVASAGQAVAAANAKHKAATGSSMTMGQMAQTFSAAQHAHSKALSQGGGHQNAYVRAMQAGQARANYWKPAEPPKGSGGGGGSGSAGGGSGRQSGGGAPRAQAGGGSSAGAPTQAAAARPAQPPAPLPAMPPPPNP